MKPLIKLHLGCWKRHLPGFIHIDLCALPHIDYQSSVDDLHMFEDESVDLIYASHVLEYFDRDEAERVLKRWHTVLKPGGVLRIAVPDFDALIKVYQKSANLSDILGPLYGKMCIENTDIKIYHKTVYNFQELKEKLERNQFAGIRTYRWQDTPPHDRIDDHSQAYFPHMEKEKGLLISLNVEGTRM